LYFWWDYCPLNQLQLHKYWFISIGSHHDWFIWYLLNSIQYSVSAGLQSCFEWFIYYSCMIFLSSHILTVVQLVLHTVLPISRFEIKHHCYMSISGLVPVIIIRPETKHIDILPSVQRFCFTLMLHYLL